MKAIQIKYLPATNTKGSRMRAIAEGCKGLTEPFDYAVSGDEQPLALAKRYVELQGWNCKVIGIGMIPNGDYVATISNNTGSNQLIETAIKYLDHPDVKAINFALNSEVVANRLRNMIN